MKHTQIKVLLDAIKQHIIQIYEENKNYISPEKTDIEKFNILQKKIYNIRNLYTSHVFNLPSCNIHKVAKNERNSPNRLYNKYYTSIMKITNIYDELKELCKHHKQMIENSPVYATCTMDMDNGTTIQKASKYIFDSYHNDHRYNYFNTQNEKNLWMIFWNQLYGENKIELHQLENLIDAGINRNIDPEKSKQYTKELDEINCVLIKEYFFKRPDMVLLKNILDLCNVDIDNYAKIFNILFVRNTNSEIVFSKNEKNNQWLVDLEKTIQHQEKPFSDENIKNSNEIKIVKMDNADLIVPYAYELPFQNKLYNALLLDKQKINSESLPKDDYELYQYIETNIFDHELKEKTDHIFENGNKALIIYDLIPNISILSYIMSLPYQANIKSINLNPKLINMQDKEDELELNTHPITDLNQQRIQSLYGFFEFWKKNKQQTFDMKNNNVEDNKTSKIINDSTTNIYYQSNIQKDFIKPSYLTAGKYLNRIIGLNTNSLEVSNAINYYKAYTGEIQLQFIPNNEADNWIKVYKSPHIESCMNKETTIDSIKSYAISSPCWNEKFFDKEKNKNVEMPQEDNHLVLCYFNTPELAQARAIVNTKSKQYVTSYGDRNTLDLLLEEHGFIMSNYAFENVEIAIKLKDNGDEIGSHYFGPYVDGKASYGDTCSFINKGQIAIINLHSCKKYSDFGLYNSESRVIEHAHEYECPCCFEVKSLENDGVPLYDVKNGDAEETGDYVCARSGCANQYHDVIYNSYTIYVANFDEAVSNDWIIQDEDGQFYVNDKDTIKYNNLVYSQHNDQWYSDSKNYVYVNDEPVDVDDATYCEFNDEYILNNNAVWSDYHDSNLSEDEVVKCKILDSDYIHESCAVEINGEYFPDGILTTDDNHNYILNDKGKKLAYMNDEEALDYMYDLQGYSYAPEEELNNEEVEVSVTQEYNHRSYKP